MMHPFDLVEVLRLETLGAAKKHAEIFFYMLHAETHMGWTKGFIIGREGMA